jgi:hypothetical protein
MIRSNILHMWKSLVQAGLVVLRLPLPIGSPSWASAAGSITNTVSCSCLKHHLVIVRTIRQGTKTKPSKVVHKNDSTTVTRIILSN